MSDSVEMSSSLGMSSSASDLTNWAPLASGIWECGLALDDTYQGFLGEWVTTRVLERKNLCLEFADLLILRDPPRACLCLDSGLALCVVTHDRGSWVHDLVLPASGNHGRVEKGEKSEC